MCSFTDDLKCRSCSPLCVSCLPVGVVRFRSHCKDIIFNPSPPCPEWVNRSGRSAFCLLFFSSGNSTDARSVLHRIRVCPAEQPAFYLWYWWKLNRLEKRTNLRWTSGDHSASFLRCFSRRILAIQIRLRAYYSYNSLRHFETHRRFFHSCVFSHKTPSAKHPSLHITHALLSYTALTPILSWILDCGNVSTHTLHILSVHKVFLFGNSATPTLDHIHTLHTMTNATSSAVIQRVIVVFSVWTQPNIRSGLRAGFRKCFAYVFSAISLPF